MASIYNLAQTHKKDASTVDDFRVSEVWGIIWQNDERKHWDDLKFSSESLAQDYIEKHDGLFHVFTKHGRQTKLFKGTPVKLK